MNLTDTHCHLDFNKFNEDRDAVIQRAIDAGVTKILIPAIDLESCHSVIKLARSHPNLYAAIGFHPTDADKWNESSKDDLRNLAQSADNKIVAIGEIGLDYYWVKETEKRARQREILGQQLNLASEVNKPVIIHLREENNMDAGEASKDVLEILETWQTALQSAGHPLAERPGVFHSFGGDLEIAQQAIAMNFYIGITGPVTFKNAPERHALVKQLPLERLLIETDAPFLTPHPHRGKRNEPAFVGEIADKIAELHSRSQSEVATITSANAARLFDWGD
ncbi:MAG: TatD family hydrolase [Anaerolineales bacterium]|nr:TatD family hydrolase [Anaerolineales bacterium]